MTAGMSKNAEQVEKIVAVALKECADAYAQEVAKQVLVGKSAQMTEAPKPKRGRPVTTGTTPPAQRAAKSRAARAEAGGERLSINLTPQAAKDLAAIQADNPDLTKTEAVHAALYAYRRNL